MLTSLKLRKNPNWDQVSDHVQDQILDQMGDQISYRVRSTVGLQVWSPVGGQVDDQVHLPLWDTLSEVV